MVTFNYTEEFLRQAKRLAKRYNSLADDINALQFELMENPETGVSLGGGKRKIRLGVKSKGGGKRGGLRVITLNGTYRPNFKPLNVSVGFNVEHYATGVANELLWALEGLIENGSVEEESE
ncbi:MAG: addiction module toxin RelE [Prevotella sp.]|nr:addiction module toxin RelE [Prevotella sp.]